MYGCSMLLQEGSCRQSTKDHRKVYKKQRSEMRTISLDPKDEQEE